ncbi:MAG: ATP-binding cassette domain-containing protein, partial [Deltaproteobacteria bacterium]|nr:ATP-binding cassette domain-containing protein [Deltaproteobacteria bacterium]
DVYLFSGTMRENILLGNPQASDEELRSSLALASLEETVRTLPLGLETPVGEGGLALSGGERQRVAAARAVLKEAPLLFLDEFTSALDGRNQQVLTRMSQSMRGRRTVLVIAHRLETIAGADRIIVLNSEGRLEDSGTHRELLERCGLYGRLWQKTREAGSFSL